MTQADIDEVWKLHLDLFEVKYERKTISSFLNKSYLCLLLVDARNNSEIVGVSVSERRWVAYCSSERVCYLATFGIRKDLQRTGLGSFLFRLTCHIQRKHFGVTRMSLNMLQTNQGVYRFYESVGMIAQKILPNYYTFDGQKHDSVVMSAELMTIQEEKRRDDISVPLEIEDILLTHDQVYFFSPLLRAP